MTPGRRYRAGESIEDHCRSCHEDRTHAVIVVDPAGRPLRVACGFCGSQHNYRGGPRMATATSASMRPSPLPIQAPSTPTTQPRPESTPPTNSPRPSEPPPPQPGMGQREKSVSTMTPIPSDNELERLLRRIVREEAGLTPVTPAEKWRGGELVLKPGRPGLQEKSWPIDAFFHKIVMLRNRLRTLEQQVNASDLPEDQKIKLQGYVTSCYGTLTSFNVLFADENDRFAGSRQD
jgi:hypothetical protein